MHKFIIAFLLVVSGCVAEGTSDAPAYEDSGPDAGVQEVVNPDVRPLDPCAPLINQYLTAWAEQGVPEGACAKLQCPEGDGSWSLMICHKTGGGPEVYWEIVQ